MSRYFVFVFCLLVLVDDLVMLSIPVQVIDWKAEMTYNVLIETLNPTHTL